MMAGAWGVAGGFAAVEVCAPLLVLCWLCCWPADDSSDSSSGKHPQKPVITHDSCSGKHPQKPVITHKAGSKRRSNELSGRRFGSSAISLHMPSTSGTKQSLSAYKSHDDIRSRRKSHNEVTEDTRYHSAPSVIDEVIHRRDWERSTKDLYIPLKPDAEEINDSNSEEDKEEITTSNEQIIERTCKKHYTNIKSSRKKEGNKELLNKDIKDKDATENINFYIGESDGTDNANENNNDKINDERNKSKAKESKQSLNESIKIQERQKPPLVTLTEFQMCIENDTNITRVEDIELDRSGAMHHSVESRSSLFNVHLVPVPPLSVEAVGYDSEPSYLAEDDVLGAWRLDQSTGARAETSTAAGRFWGRARHGSAGDVLAPTLRPHSAALSESDLDFELDECDELPPAYDQLHLHTPRERKETAI